MRVLVVKLTSMGDVLHLMPALSDLKAAHDEVTVDWLVESSFAEIPQWHPSVDRVLTVSTRRWRKLNRQNIVDFFAAMKRLRKHSYDYVIDAQGLMKSAGIAWFARLNKGGVRAGFSGASIKESPAAWFYRKKVDVPRQQHAIERLRQLLAGVFEYRLDAALNYDVQLPANSETASRASILLFHGTTWASKHVPDQLWRELVEVIAEDGYQVQLCWGNEKEQQRAHWIAEGNSNAVVLPKSSLTEVAQTLATASGAIAVDTGLGHMAAALGIPSISLYGSTDASLTGTLGERQWQWQSDYPCSPCLLKQCDKLTEQTTVPPCYKQFAANEVWQALHQKIL